MANREALGIIRRARTGDSHSQLALGKLYLYGSAGLPKSLPTALHWLHRAAQQNCDDACLLIGAHVPLEVARHNAAAIIPWYERAYDGGVVQAGLVLAQLVLDGEGVGDVALRTKALRALEAAALAGLPDAQWLLAQHGLAQHGMTEHGMATPEMAAPVRHARAEGQEWLIRAADSGVGGASHALLEQAWGEGDAGKFLRRALPMARLLAQADASMALAPQELLLLSRCAQLLIASHPRHDACEAETYRFCELAARGGDRAAQLALGLCLARMDARGGRRASGAGVVNFKRAIGWLTQAGEQGLAEAWFVLSRIYIKPEFSQRSVTQAQSCLERAADMGHSEAQLECGIQAWRTRRDGENNDVRAAYWLIRAAAQGSAEAEAALRKIAPDAGPAPWLPALAPLAMQELASRQPLLAARLELAQLFQLSRAETLLLDVNGADQGHCLVVDIGASYGRGKRRVILLRTAFERRALDRIGRVFERANCSLDGPEGNYRQRLYRLKTCLQGMEGGSQANLLPA
ncbi:TPR repeat protein [Oxalobacteraceae bacterium GrIS 1.11]